MTNRQQRRAAAAHNRRARTAARKESPGLASDVDTLTLIADALGVTVEHMVDDDATYARALALVQGRTETTK